MAKIKAPLFSLDAAGTLDKNITYKKKSHDNIAQKYATPGSKNPFESSPRQKDQRSIIRLITIHWQCMSSINKLTWENAAKNVRFKGTGYHYFLHMAQQNLTQYLGLVSYWSMNYNIDDKIPDLSGNGNDGVLSPIHPYYCPTLVDSFDKKHGKSLKFDGVNDYVNAGNATSLQVTGSITVEVCIYPTKINTWQGIVCKLSAFPSTGYTLRFNTSNYLEFIQFLNGVVYGSSTFRFSPNIWQHIVGIITPTRIKVYSNGKLKSSLSSGGALVDSNDNLYIGSYGYPNPAYYYKGLIDEVCFYNRALGSEEVLKHYQSYSL